MEHLSAAWLRQCFSCASVADTQTKNDHLIAAAVLVPIVARPAALTVLLTQRTAHLRDHAGQISFPGGRCEPGDATLLATALREAREEIGLRPEQIEILGNLGEFCTGTGFAVTAIAALVEPPLELKLDDFEVADVFEPPLEFFLHAENFRRHPMKYQDTLREYCAVPWRDRFIWGVTAEMLASLRMRLCGRL